MAARKTAISMMILGPRRKHARIGLPSTPWASSHPCIRTRINPPAKAPHHWGSANMATTDSVGEIAAVNLQRHKSAIHQSHGLGLSGFRTLYTRPLFRAFGITQQSHDFLDASGA